MSGVQSLGAGGRGQVGETQKDRKRQRDRERHREQLPRAQGGTDPEPGWERPRRWTRRNREDSEAQPRALVFPRGSWRGWEEAVFRRGCAASWGARDPHPLALVPPPTASALRPLPAVGCPPGPHKAALAHLLRPPDRLRLALRVPPSCHVARCRALRPEGPGDCHPELPAAASCSQKRPPRSGRPR